MRKWILCVGVVLALCLVPGLMYGQGRRPMGPRFGGPGFGPGPRAERESRDGDRFKVREEKEDAHVSQLFRDEKMEDRDDDSGELQPFRTEESERHHRIGHRLAEFAHRVGPAGMLLILVVGVPVLVVLFWVLPITLGVWIARRRKLSPLWMLFGIHPLGGWIACLVLALCKGNVECGTCGGYVRRNFRQCPFCHGAVPPPNAAA